MFHTILKKRLKRQKMQFEFKKTTYKVSFSFLSLILLTLTTDKTKTLGILLLFAIAHEMVHLMFIYIFSLSPKEVVFTLFGANIKRGNSTSNDINSEILINLSAPVFNIFAGAFFYFLSKLNINYNGLFTEISNINVVLGLFNLIPFYTFDGGNALKYVLLKFFNEVTTEKVITIVSLLVTVGFSFLSIHIFLNYQHNFSLLIMCIYMFLSIIFKKQNALDY